jgi:hypothetical protein
MTYNLPKEIVLGYDELGYEVHGYAEEHIRAAFEAGCVNSPELESERAKNDIKFKQIVYLAGQLAVATRERNELQAKLDTALMDVTCIPDMTEEITFLGAKLSALESQEPVAWIVYAKGSRRYYTLTFDVSKVPEIYIGGDAIPLYAAHGIHAKEKK